MRVVGFDAETALIGPALLAPPLVCVTWQRPGVEARIVAAGDAKPVIRDWLLDADTLLVGHNVAYDLAVVGEAYPDLMPLIFAAYDADRVTDTKLREQLLDIARGTYRGRPDRDGKWIVHEYTLEALARRCAGMQLQKDAWRLSYGEFLGLPLGRWPDKAREVQARARVRLAELEAIPHQGEDDKAIKVEIKGLREMVDGDPSRCTTYPLDDARATLAVYQAQEVHAEYLKDQFRQARAAWALHLSSAWGIRTDPPGVDIIERDAAEQVEELRTTLIDAKLVREDGTRDLKAATARMIEVCKRDGRKLRRTASHTRACEANADCHASLDSDACKATEDEVLVAYAELSVATKVLTNDCVVLRKGCYYPIHPRYDIAETGRTTCSGGNGAAPGANIQNLRRRTGIREAFVPRDGHVFAQCDYPQLELFTLAQCCVKWIGRSKLADALNAGLDPHLAVAAQILGISYAAAKERLDTPEVDAARQTAKVANFGFPGGLGIKKLCLFAKKAYNVELTPARAKELKDQWFSTWPEMQSYFARINALCDDEAGANVETLFTERYRGGATYCAACNNGFQALGADCAKRALWLIAHAQYTQTASPLWNSRTVAFVHDEIIIEADERYAANAAHELARVMRDGANHYLPDVPIPESKMKPLLMRRWSKKAKPVFDVSGRLVPWCE